MNAPAPTTRFPLARRIQVLAAFILATALLVPLGVLFEQFWTSTGKDREIAADERSGVAYLRPLIGLVGALDEAQSLAVRGQAVDTQKMRNAITAVDDADRAQGGPLRVQERWSSLRSQIDGMLARADGPGRPAYDAYGQSVDLLLALAVKVGDESQLILDPEIDTYYLVDTVLLRIPPVVVDGGRAADLPLVVPQVRSEPDERNEPQPTPEPVQVTAAEDRVARAAAAIDAGLKKSFDATASHTLGSNLIGQLDAFRSPVSALAPGDALAAPSTTRADPAVVAATRIELRTAALALGEATLNELDALITVRENALADARSRAVAAAVVGVVIAACILWLRLPDPGRAAPDPGVEPEQSLDAVAYPVERDLVDARELLADAELIHVGRALRPPARREPADDG